MTTPYEIPLSAQPQTLQITLNSVVYTLTVRWNNVSGAWILDIGDSNNNPILCGIPLVTGCDLLAQHAYLNFGGQLIAQSDDNLNAPPALTTLGTTGHLYFVVK